MKFPISFSSSDTCTHTKKKIRVSEDRYRISSTWIIKFPKGNKGINVGGVMIKHRVKDYSKLKKDLRVGWNFSLNNR